MEELTFEPKDLEMMRSSPEIMGVKSAQEEEGNSQCQGCGVGA